MKIVNAQLVEECLSLDDFDEIDELIEGLITFEESRVWEGIKLFEEIEKIDKSLTEISELFYTIQEMLEKLINIFSKENENMVVSAEVFEKTLFQETNVNSIYFVDSKSLFDFYLEAVETLAKADAEISILSQEKIQLLKNNSLLLRDEEIIHYEQSINQLKHYYQFTSIVIHVYETLCSNIQIVYNYYFKYNYINKLYPKKYLISREIIENKAKVLYTEKMELNTSELSGWIICANKDEIKKKNDKSFFKSLTASQICELSEEKKFYNERIFELLLDIYKMPYGTKIEWHYHKEGWIDKLTDLNTNNDVDFPADESIEEINRIVELP